MALIPCTSCSRHVRLSSELDATCPFCGAPIAQLKARSSSAQPSHLGRAALLFVGATTITACGKTTAESLSREGAAEAGKKSEEGKGRGMAVPAYGAPPPNPARLEGGRNVDAHVPSATEVDSRDAGLSTGKP